MATGYFFGQDKDVPMFQATQTDPETPATPGGEETPVQGGCEQGCAQARSECYNEFGADSIYCGNAYQECMQGCADTGEGPGTDPTTPVTPGSPCTGGTLASASGLSTDSIQWVPDDEWGQYGWNRPSTGNMAAHWYWHPNYGIHDSDTVRKHAQEGVEPVINQGGAICPKGKSMMNSGGERWCCPGDDTTTTGGLGEFQWPSEMQNYYKMLMGRGTDLLGMPLGLTQEEQDAMFGKGFENVRGQEGSMQNELTSWLQSMGALGTGTELEQRGKASRGIQENISDLMRDILMYNSERKKSDLLDYTGASQSIFGQGMDYNQIMEAINAARRGEGTDALNKLIAYWMGLKY